jgi:vacuolar-type H+-ATPase subunit I/STV1
MRNVQIGLFGYGLLCFVIALFFIGQEMGDTLWKAGVAGLLLDLVAIQLWPAPKKSS